LPNQSGGVDARSVYTLAANANTVNPSAAYGFIKLMLDRGAMSCTRISSSLPVNRELLVECIDTAVQNTPSTGILGFERGEISAEMIDQYWRLIDEIDHCAVVSLTFQSYGEDEIFLETMMPYLQDENDFEQCFKDFKERLEVALQNTAIY